MPNLGGKQYRQSEGGTTGHTRGRSASAYSSNSGEVSLYAVSMKFFCRAYLKHYQLSYADSKQIVGLQATL